MKVVFANVSNPLAHIWTSPYFQLQGWTICMNRVARFKSIWTSLYYQLQSCKVEPLTWTARHGSRAFKPCLIFKCKVKPRHVILNRLEIQKKNNEEEKITNDDDKNIIPLFTISKYTKRTVLCTISITIRL